MNLRKKAKDTLDGVSDAAEQVIDTSQWATVALVSVCMVSVLALVAGVLALGAARSNETGRAYACR